MVAAATIASPRGNRRNRKMTLKDLNKDQRKQLKARLLDDELMEVEGRTASYGEIANADEIVSDEKLEEAYGATSFVPDDFWS